ncbi:MAG: endonuclease III [Thermoflexales bacterium]|nr:endonuclease III [Thermoflexales bacterium]
MSESALSRLRRKTLRIHQVLLERYGEPRWTKLDGISELVATILSQNTNDGNRDLAYSRLRARFPSWEAVRDADPQAVIEAIRPAGLANQKGPRIQSALRRITEIRGKLELDFLAEMPLQEARDWLLSLGGVGMKTASIVLLFCYRHPAFPVDTHVHRVTGRLGLRPEKMNADQTHLHMEALCPAGAHGPLHLNLIRLGREICQARRPNCPHCPLRRLCSYAQTHPSTSACAPSR